MRILITTLLFMAYSGLQGQNLQNTEWIKIKAERKDGSRIISHLLSDKVTIKYLFQEDSVLVSLSNQYSYTLKYTARNNILSMGGFQKYQIDTVNDKILVITEIPREELPDDKINSIVFINSLFLFDYLAQNKQLDITGDSLIQCNNQFSPTYRGDLADVFLKQFQHTTADGVLTATLILSADGKIKSVQIDPDNKFSRKEIEKIISIIKSTAGFWIIPTTTKPFQFKISFTLTINFSAFLATGINISFYKKKPDQNKQSDITMQKIAEADIHFNNGVKLFNREKYAKAVDEFTKCTGIDSLYVDAYYNLAFSYQKLGNTELACETWNKLKEMGQKQGKFLYEANCK